MEAPWERIRTEDCERLDPSMWADRSRVKLVEPRRIGDRVEIWILPPPSVSSVKPDESGATDGQGTAA